LCSLLLVVDNLHESNHRYRLIKATGYESFLGLTEETNVTVETDGDPEPLLFQQTIDTTTIYIATGHDSWEGATPSSPGKSVSD
jgi:hypothetical protein